MQALEQAQLVHGDTYWHSLGGHEMAKMAQMVKMAKIDWRGVMGGLWRVRSQARAHMVKNGQND